MIIELKERPINRCRKESDSPALVQIHITGPQNRPKSVQVHITGPQHRTDRVQIHTNVCVRVIVRVFVRACVRACDLHGTG